MKLISGLAAVAIAATTLASPAATAPAQAAPTADRAVEAGARWMTGQLTGGLVHNDQFGGFDDYGLSADFAFALEAVGKRAAASGIVDAIEPKSDSWVTDGTPNRVYAGSLAKLVSVAQATGQDPRTFNGTDQVARLESHVSAAGRLEDSGVDPTNPWDADYVNVIGQSFAARGLTTAGSAEAEEATDFLLAQQCSAGFFRATLTADKSSAQQGCVDGTHAGSVDTTAFAVINILETPGASTRARGAAALAASWLRTQQAADGSFSSGSEGYNANSTGLAGWALEKADRSAAAAQAAKWLRGVQIADLAPCATTLSADNGGVTYQPAVLAAARTTGISPAARDQYRRATAQALPALRSLPAAAGTLGISAPTTAVEQGTVTVTVTGLGDEEPACVSFRGQARKVVGTGSDVRVTFQLPAGAATHTYTLTTLDGTRTATTVATVAPVPTPPVATAPALGRLKVSEVERVTNRKAAVAVVCAGRQDCRGTLVVRTQRKVELPGGTTRKLVVARVAYAVEPRTTDKVVLQVRRPVLRALRTGRLPVVAEQRVAGADAVRTRFSLRRA